VRQGSTRSPRAWRARDCGRHGGAPQLRELGDRLVAVGEDGRVPQSLRAAQLDLEPFGIALATHDTRPLPALFVAPAHPPHVAAVPPDALDAHYRSSGGASLSTSARNCPTERRGCPGRDEGATARGGLVDPEIHAPMSSGAMRSRDLSLEARSSPSSMARRTAFSDRPQSRATSATESRCQSPTVPRGAAVGARGEVAAFDGAGRLHASKGGEHGWRRERMQRASRGALIRRRSEAYLLLPAEAIPVV
jgi:hypothetical protein